MRRRFRLRAVAIIPLGPGSHLDSSSLPEGTDEPGWLSPPIWPCTTRGLPCRPDYSGRGGLLPHRFTLTCAIAFRNPLARTAFRPSEGFPSAGHRGALHRRFIFCGTVRNRLPASLARTARKAGPLALPGALPCGLRRSAPETFVAGTEREDHGVRTFLPARLLAKVGPAITRLARQIQYNTGVSVGFREIA